ncbi:hypothetical protein I540_2189 [Mycobacteroides abscessus subsp. bolletii 1513]|uniref:Uncharacterized protein n=1 Tax=Mycobacteroides abscessus subsp. bolletii 1513 TaxID=1299321 RepID=X8DPF5_9MYCO|nr:hypothetical protein I540_2189 [Mycobacteroides abscessus subsp. bolletii 1513]
MLDATGAKARRGLQRHRIGRRGTTAPITGAAAAWAAARRAVSASTAALVAVRPSGTTLRFIVGTPFPEQHAH